MKLIIAGSRSINLTTYNLERIANVIIPQFETMMELIIVSGECTSGPDKTAMLLAKSYFGSDWNRELREGETCGYKGFPAEWNDEEGNFDKAAGHKRNKVMAEYADALLLIWDGQSAGSKNMLKEMKALKKPVYEVILRKHNV